MQLRAALADSQVNSTAAVGLDPDWVEAAAFAWLAMRTMDGLTGNLPGVTGAQRATILGAIFPAD
jgi:anhydro-N-acetylmuramic acid kinase